MISDTFFELQIFLLSRTLESLCLGANFSALVGPNKEMIGTLLNESICIMPLSIVMARSNLIPRQVTKAGELKEVSCSGNNAYGIKFLIFSFSS